MKVTAAILDKRMPIKDNLTDESNCFYSRQLDNDQRPFDWQTERVD